MCHESSMCEVRGNLQRPERPRIVRAAQRTLGGGRQPSPSAPHQSGDARSRLRAHKQGSSPALMIAIPSTHMHMCWPVPSSCATFVLRMSTFYVVASRMRTQPTDARRSAPVAPRRLGPRPIEAQQVPGFAHGVCTRELSAAIRYRGRRPTRAPRRSGSRARPTRCRARRRSRPSRRPRRPTPSAEES